MKVDVECPESRPTRPKNLQEEIGKRHPFEILEQETYLNLIRTAEHLATEFHRLFKTHGISPPQYNVLRIVKGHGPEGIRTQCISRDMVTREPDITRLVDRLEQSGFVQRRRCTNDRRVVYVTLTPRGDALLNELEQPVNDLHRKQLGGINRADLAKLNELLFRARHVAGSD